MLRALREVAGVSQAGWVALLQLAAQEHGLAIAASEDTLQRWEAGRSVPDAAAEGAILAVCRERGLLRAYTSGVLAGETVTAETLRSLLAEARLGGRRRSPILQAPPARPPSNLPAALSSFVGRRQELAEAAQVLATTRLLTLTGTGGVGKTRLALELAHSVEEHYPEGVRLVELAPLAEGALVTQAVAAALGVPEAAGQALPDLLVDRLRSARSLLLLDNCEHVSAAAAALVTALLRACPSLRVLATSRQPLGVTGEALWRVPPMRVPDAVPAIPSGRSGEAAGDPPDAVRLFLERARAARADAALPPESMAAVAAICRRLDGIPLAIELAAARTRVLTVEQIAARLEVSHGLIGGAAAGRHETLTAAIDWSYALLTEEERTLFRRLAVFAGGFTLEAMEAVCADPPADAIATLAGLVDKSLVLMERGPGGEGWYRLLEPLRGYAAARMDEAGERERLEGRHADWYLALVEERAGTGVKGPEQAYWLARLDLEMDNLRAALRLTGAGAAEHRALRLATALADYWLSRGYFVEGSDRLEAALAAPESRAAAPRLRAAALNAAGILAARHGDYRRARALLGECLDLARASEDRLFTARALNHLGITAREQGDLAGARTAYEAALAIFEEVDDRRGIAVINNNLGNVAREQGQLDLARRYYETVLAIGHERRDDDDIARALHHLGLTALERDDLAGARGYFEDSLARRRGLGSNLGTSSTLATLGTLAAIEGDAGHAEAFFEESLALARQSGHDRDAAHTLRSRGWAALDLGDPRARAFFEESLSIARRLGDRATVAEALAREGLNLARAIGFRRAAALALLALAEAHAALGRVEDAAAAYREALTEARDLESVRLAAACFEGLAALAEDIAPERAARLLGTAAALRGRIAVPLPPARATAQAALIAALRAALGGGAFERAWVAGRATPLQTAIAETLTGGV